MSAFLQNNTAPGVTSDERQLSVLCSFLLWSRCMGSVAGTSEARQSSQVSVYPGGWTAAWGQDLGSGTRGRGQGLSSDGIHTEDVETDIVRGRIQSFLHFSCCGAEDFTRRAKGIRDGKHISSNSEVLIRQCICRPKCCRYVLAAIMTGMIWCVNTTLQRLCFLLVSK